MKRNIDIVSEEKAIYSMMQLLEIDLETEIKIRRVIEKIGLKEFFLLIDLLNFTDEIKEKVKALKEVGDEHEK
jgi:hypothetical protein